MKNSILFVFVVLMVLTAKLSISQQYFPFPIASAMWSENCSQFEIYPYPHHEHHTIRYFINGDTLIDSISYSKLYVYGGATEEVDTTNSSLMGGLREDSLMQILFYPIPLEYLCYHCNLNEIWAEFVLYKFGAETGDTIELGGPMNNIPDYTVGVIDSILVDSKYRKRYEMIPVGIGGTYNHWIEGIGSDLGLFGPSCQPFEGYMELLCYEDPVTFFNPGDDGCFIWTYVSINENENQTGPQISPVPAKAKLYINLSHPTIGMSLRLINSKGQTMKQLQMEDSSKEYEINIEDYPSGLYVVVLLNNGQVINTQKVIIAD